MEDKVDLMTVALTDNIVNKGFKSTDEGVKLFIIEKREFSFLEYHTDCKIKALGDYQTNEFSLIKEVTIMNHTDKYLNDLTLSFNFSSEIFSMNNVLLKSIEPNTDVTIKVPFLMARLDKFDFDNEITENVRFLLTDDSGNEITSEEVAFTVLPIAQPPRYARVDMRLYTKYVTPNASGIKELTLNAVKYLKNKTAFMGYNGTLDDIYDQVRALYDAVYNYGINYQLPPAGGLYILSDNLDMDSQRLRLPADVLKDRKGTCIDLTLLFAALLEEVGLKPIIVVEYDHAFVGVFLKNNDMFINGEEERITEIYNGASVGVNRFLLFDATFIANNSGNNFDNAVKQGFDNVKNYKEKFFKAIDVLSCHSTIFSPIPLKLDDELLELEENDKLNDKSESNIIETKILTLDSSYEKDRFSFWDKKLLDLTEINPLVNFRQNLTNCIKLKAKKPIYQMLEENEAVKLYSIAKKNKNDVFLKSQEELFKSYDINDSYVNELSIDDKTLFSIGYDSTLKNLIKKNKTAVEETGAQTLYLCLGVLEYKTKKNTIGHAPFMVLPVSITKDKSGDLYTVNYDYDNLMMNETFFEYYSLTYGKSYKGYYNLAGKNSYLDIVRTFKEEGGDIKLLENSYFLANLTFSHYIMWLDIKMRSDELKKNKIVESIIESRNLLEDKIDEDVDIENAEKYEEFAAPLYYDSTQLKAILACGNGKSFILDGPPGTGKSQTIVNMIVNAFLHKKTVLFVAEKKAALDVVYKRLEKIKLDRFALELHSNKASKQEFFKKLDDTINLGNTKDADEFLPKCYDLDSKKEGILSTINLMREGKYYYSLYQSILSYLNLSKKYDYKYTFDEEYLKSLDKEKYENTLDMFNTAVTLSEHINDYDTTLLRAIKKDYINLYDKDEFISDFNGLNNLLNEFMNQFDSLKESFNEIDYTISNTVLLLKILNNIYDHKLYFGDVNYFISNNNDEELFNLLEKGLELSYILKDNSLYDIDKVLSINTDAAIEELSSEQGFFKKIKIKSKYKNELKSLLINGNKLPKKDYLLIYKDFKKLKELHTTIESNKDIIEKITGLDYMSILDSSLDIKDIIINTREFINDVIKLDSNYTDNLMNFIELYKSKDERINMLRGSLNNKLNSFIDNYKALVSKYEIDELMINDSFDNVLGLINEAIKEENFTKVIDIVSINKEFKKKDELNVSSFIDEMYLSKFDISIINEIYELSLADSYIRLYFKDDKINFFNPIAFNKEIEKYKSLIDDYNNIVIKEVSSRLSKNLINTSIKYAESSPIGRLKKVIQSMGRGTTIRETLVNYNDIIKSYYPCFLMSPLSVAQYLPVNQDKFDIVIFDEASQIPVHEAIGPIARGKSLIVAGDPMQMPPTMYFQADVSEDANVSYEDSPSLLDECLAIELPRIRLKYHYRSHNEELIRFSNEKFYDKSLYTFPESKNKDVIDFKYVELKESKKTSDITKEEIDAIVNTVKDVYSKEENKDKSLGIIVFNMKQQEKVYDAISNLCAQDKSLAKILDNINEQKGEELFVKSIENVQGDERDIIILSVGFRLNQMGRASVVGPIVKANGERRLNVAVSRSKEQMIVISTIKPENFPSDEEITSEGALMLKHFLKYAEDVSESKIDKGSKSEIKEIKDYIAEDLRRLGYKAVTNVGDSAFKVDVAVLDENGIDYKLGIIIDNELISNTSLRDKIYVMNNVLNNLSWKLITVYSVEYFKNKNACLDRIIDALDDPFKKEVHKLNPVIEKNEEKEEAYDKLPYKVCQTDKFTKYDNESGFDYNLGLLLRDILEQEAPLSFNILKDRVKEHSNIKVMSQKAQMRLQMMLKVLQYPKTLDQDGSEFYWDKTSNLTVTKYRAAFKRDLSDIAKEEIICAMNNVFEVQGNITGEDLYKFTLIALGFDNPTLTKANKERLAYVYNYAVENNLLIAVE